ncbi:MAG TPA: hypothetical protein VJV03_09965 [Pyrinomonadaceae bacterium]|nr:hypothetical protein [Pyrinomonadaceae bacterium]
MGQRLPELAAHENLETVGGLFACPDCQHHCSNFAETCPGCGRFFRSYSRIYRTRPGEGWSMAVFWGIMLAWIIPMFVGLLLFIILLVIGGIGAATLTQPLREPTSTRQP